MPEINHIGCIETFTEYVYQCNYNRFTIDFFYLYSDNDSFNCIVAKWKIKPKKS